MSNIPMIEGKLKLTKKFQKMIREAVFDYYDMHYCSREMLEIIEKENPELFVKFFNKGVEEIDMEAIDEVMK